MKKKFPLSMGLVAILALALALTGCAENASGNTNASTSESVDVNANTQRPDSLESLDGTAWVAEKIMTEGSPDWPVSYRLEFYDNQAYLIMLHYSKFAGAEKMSYSFENGILDLGSENLTDEKYEDDTIYFVTSRSYSWTFHRVTPLGIEVMSDSISSLPNIWDIDIRPWVDEMNNEAYEAMMNPENSSGGNGQDQPETTPGDNENPEVNPAQDDYTYDVNGHSVILHTRLEDYIDNGEIDLERLIHDLGYTPAGFVYNDQSKPVAQIGRFVHISDGRPCYNIEINTNIAYRYEDDANDRIYIYDTSGNSGILVINGLGNPIYISYNQLIVATCIWETYSDGKTHDNPLNDVFGYVGPVREYHYDVS